MSDVPTELLIAIVTSTVAAVASIVVAVINMKSNQDVKSYRKSRERKDVIKSGLDIGVARILLLNNYEKVCQKGYYSTAERDVYHSLYEAYKEAGGNGVIDDIAEKIVLLPTQPTHLESDKHSRKSESVIDEYQEQ